MRNDETPQSSRRSASLTVQHVSSWGLTENAESIDALATENTHMEIEFDEVYWSEETMALWDAHCSLEEIAKNPTPGELETFRKTHSNILSYREDLMLSIIQE